MKPINHVIFDVHGQIQPYLHILEKLNASSVQLGDFGFGFAKIDPIIPLNSFDIGDCQHRVGEGNHDCYAVAKHHPSVLPRFGLIQENPSIFWVCGAYTPPELYPIRPGINWWQTEELFQLEMEECETLYKQVKPEIVISHDGPYDIVNSSFGVKENRTNRFLQKLIDIHKPKIQIFGHYHQRLRKINNGTLFVCGNILDIYNIKEDTFGIPGFIS